MDNNCPTRYAQVNALLGELLIQVKATLDAQYVGLYLYGSLADGDFQPERSDVDFLVLTRQKLAASTVAALAGMHGRFVNSSHPWAAKLEGAYVPLADIGRYDPDGGPYPQINEGRFFIAGHGYDWIIQRHLLRRQGVVVDGPPIAPLIAPVTAVALRQAVIQLLQSWWGPMLNRKNRLHEGAYQTFAVLSMCRALNTLATGTAVTKTAAAVWALTDLDNRWRPLIEWALTQSPAPPAADQDEVAAFIRYTLRQAGLTV